MLQAQSFRGLDKSPLDMIEYPTASNQSKPDTSWLAFCTVSPQLKGT